MPRKKVEHYPPSRQPRRPRRVMTREENQAAAANRIAQKEEKNRQKNQDSATVQQLAETRDQLPEWTTDDSPITAETAEALRRWSTSPKIRDALLMKCARLAFAPGTTLKQFQTLFRTYMEAEKMNQRDEHHAKGDTLNVRAIPVTADIQATTILAAIDAEEGRRKSRGTRGKGK